MKPSFAEIFRKSLRLYELSWRGGQSLGHKTHLQMVVVTAFNYELEAWTKEVKLEFLLSTVLAYCPVQFSSVAYSCPTLCDPMNCSTPGLPVHHQLPEFTQTYVHRVSDAIQPSHPLSSPSLLPPIPPSIRVFSNESTLHMRWPKYWSFNISPSNEHPGLISFRMDWLDLLAVQGTLKSLPQHHSSKATILRSSAFFTVQLSHHTWLMEKP